MTTDHVKDIERGCRHVTIDEACAIAHALQIRLTRLLAPSHLVLVPNRPVPGFLADHGPLTAIATGGRITPPPTQPADQEDPC